MKNTILFFAIVFCFQLSAQRKPKIKGNKNVVEITDSLPPFNSILLDDDLEIILRKSAKEGYEMVADDNLTSVLKFEVKDQTLNISSYYRITAKKELKITVDYVELNKITMNDGSISMKDIIPADELTVSTHGDAKLQLNANASKVSINMHDDSMGNFNLVGDSLNVSLKDRIEARIYTMSEVNTVKMSNKAEAKLEGSTKTFSIDLVEEAELYGELLEAENVVAYVQNSVLARIHALKDLKLSSRGSSQTYLSGDAKITILDFLGNAELHKRQRSVE